MLSVWLTAAGAARAEERYYLSQVANGASGGASFRTTFVLLNNSDVEARTVLKLTGDDGKPLIVNLGGLGSRSEFEIVVGAGATQILQTDGAGTLVSGAATLTASGPIGVSAVFGLYGADGRFVTEAGVGSSTPLTEFVLPVDTTGLFNTGLALFNPGTSRAAISLVLRDTAGQPLGQANLDLDAGAHIPRFVAGSGQLFPAAVNVRGTLLVRSSTPVAALGLRQHEPPLSYTSLPVVPSSSDRLTQNLAHVVNGSYGGGSYRTSFLLFNLSSGPARAALALTRDDGSPFPIGILGSGTGSTFDVTLPVGGAAFLQTDGLGEAAQGAATITSSAPVGAAAIFSVFDSSGMFQTEAGVGDSPVMTALTLPVDVRPGANTGVAFSNPSGAAAAVTLKLLDSNGEVLDSGTSVELRAKGHTARFVTEIFPGITYFQGSVAVIAPSGVAALTLRQNAAPLSYTTLPVASGHATGKAPPAPLMTKTRDGLSATSDLAVDETLPSGFRLAGHVAGTGNVRQVLARRSDGKVYYGEIDTDTNRYLLAVDQGSYTVQVSYQALEVPGGATLTQIYSDPAPVRVDGDITRNLTLPLPRTYQVTGKVSGLSSLPDSTGAMVVFTSEDRLTEGAFPLNLDGSYQAVLPRGSYRIGVRVPQIIFPPVQSQSLELYSLGAVGVDGGAATANITVPATARVSGSVRAPWLGSFAFGIKVAATDLSAPPFSGADTIRPLALSIASADPSAQYQAFLAGGRSYALTVSAPVLDGSKRVGSFSYPLSEPFSLTGDATRSFNLPDVPAKVNITGRVRDSQGRGVGSVLVSAATKALTGAPGASFSANAITDAQGNYSLVVLSGTGYQLEFLPPAPAR